MSGHEVRSFQNDKGKNRQVDTITMTSAVAATTYTFTIDLGNGPVAVSYLSGATTSLAAIRDGLIAAARAKSEFEDKVFPNVGGASALTLTATKPGEGFTTAESDANLTLANTTPNVVTEPIPFGRAVVRGSTGVRSAILPSTTGQKFEGVVERVHSNVDPIEGSADEVTPFSDMSVGHKGMWYVQIEEDVTPQDDVFFRHTAGAGGTQPGAWRTDADTATADQVTNARWVDNGTAGGLGLLALNEP